MDSEKIYNEIKRREALRENEPELRSLKQKLHNDLIRKTQQCQIKEKEYASLRNKIELARDDEIIHKNILNEMKLQKNNINQLCKFKKSYGNELQVQMKLKQVSKTNEIKVRELEEQEEIQKMLERLDEEYIMCLQRKKEFIEQLQKEREVLKQAREAEKRRNKLLSLEESRRIDQINQELDERLKRQVEEHKIKIDIRESLKNKIAQNLDEQMKQQIERTKLIEELQEYEIKLRDAAIESNRNIKDENKIKSYRCALEKQIEEYKAKEKLLKKLEYQYKIQLVNELKRQKQYDNIEERHEKERQIKYADDIKEQIGMNINRQIETQSLIKMTNDYIKQFNAAREQQISEEKQQMILEHTQKFS